MTRISFIINTSTPTPPPTPGDRGIFIGGTGAQTDEIEYITISSTGNSTYFGDLLFATYEMGTVANGGNNRGVWGGNADGLNKNTISYVTINTLGNSSDFGDLLANNDSMGAHSNGYNERGIFGGGQASGPGLTNVIQYITINSIGNSTDFGDLTSYRKDLAGSSNATNERGIFGGGVNPESSNVLTIDYITINSLGNATDFGDLTVARQTLASSSNGTNERAIFGGGSNGIGSLYNTIDYVTINSAGNATDFGDLTFEGSNTYGNISATSNGTSERGVFAGGDDLGESSSNVIQYVTINSTGNATDFGDLTSVNTKLGATSNS